MSLSGVRALVTGAAGGIGAAIVRRLLADGARVVGLDIVPVDAWELSPADGLADALVLDLTAEGAPAAAVAVVQTALGGLDVLVNNAGRVASVELGELTAPHVRALMDVNVTAPFLLAAAGLEALKESGRGRIINIGSVNSRVASRGASVYTASKHAVAGMTKAMAAELGRWGITANYVMPGPVLTPMTRDFDKSWRDYFEERIPVGRLVSGDDIAAAVAFLARNDAAMVNGHGLCVDGGLTARV